MAPDCQRMPRQQLHLRPLQCSQLGGRCSSSFAESLAGDKGFVSTLPLDSQSCSTSVIIREMQARASRRYPPSAVRVAVTKRQEMVSAGKGVRKQGLHALLLGMQAGAAAVENSMAAHEEVKNFTTGWSRNVPLVYIQRKWKWHRDLKITCTTMSLTALFTGV